jgi:hypothetical protein
VVDASTVLGREFREVVLVLLARAWRWESERSKNGFLRVGEKRCKEKVEERTL